MGFRGERRDAAEHRIRILMTARRLFREHGIDKVSMHQIAKCAGVGQGTLYRRYGSKGDLCMDLLEDRFVTFKRDLLEYLEAAGREPAVMRLAYALDRTIEFIEENGPWLLAIGAQHPEKGQESIYRSVPYKFLHGVSVRLIKEIRQDIGHPATEPEADFAAHAVLGSICPGLYFEMRRGRQLTMEQIKSLVRSMYVDRFIRPS